MNKKNAVLLVPILLALALTGCNDKEDTGSSMTPSESSVTSTESAAPAPDQLPEMIPAPEETPLDSAEVPTEMTEAELQSTVQSYQAEVDASNDKARGVIDAYNDKIREANGK